MKNYKLASFVSKEDIKQIKKNWKKFPLLDEDNKDEYFG